MNCKDGKIAYIRISIEQSQLCEKIASAERITISEVFRRALEVYASLDVVERQTTLAQVRAGLRR